MKAHFCRRVVGSIVLGAVLVSCSSSDTTMGATSKPATSAPDSMAPDTTTPDTIAVVEPAFPMVRGSRYCELLFLRATKSGIQATVYGSQGRSYCPQADWEALDTTPLAAQMDALFVLRNGPRVWLVDSVVKTDIDESERLTFGNLEMNRLATVDISDPSTVGRPYTWQEVDRRSVFTFAAGSTEYFLTDPEGDRYVMQAYSLQLDPTVDEASLSTLGDRLALPDGWTYSVEVIDEDLVVDTMTTKARVLQDEFQNSYSRIPTSATNTR
ncbi:MAG: hypothetical protein ACKOCE_02160 [Acidimicrobiia bacterium]